MLIESLNNELAKLKKIYPYGDITSFYGDDCYSIIVTDLLINRVIIEVDGNIIDNKLVIERI